MSSIPVDFGHGNYLSGGFLYFFWRSELVPIICSLNWFYHYFTLRLVSLRRSMSSLACIHVFSSTRLLNSSHTHLCFLSCTDPAVCTGMIHCALVFYPYLRDGAAPQSLYISKLQSLHPLMVPPRAPTTNSCLPCQKDKKNRNTVIRSISWSYLWGGCTPRVERQSISGHHAHTKVQYRIIELYRI